MTVELMKKIEEYLKHKETPLFGIASAERLNQIAPEGFRPEDVLPGAKSVLIFAKPAPLANYMAPVNEDLRSFYVTSYHTHYRGANEVANSICFMLEEAGFLSLPIPSYSPLKFENGHYNGMISLKHAAVEAGLGKIGKNTLLIHPERGNNLRFGGLITTLELPSDGVKSFPELCPEGCTICYEVCPVNALSDEGIDHLKCMSHCIKHTFLPPLWIMKIMRTMCSKRFLNLFAMSFFENYGVNCCECLKKCPHFPGFDLKDAVNPKK